MIVRDDGRFKAWKDGEVELIIADGRLHLIFGRSLNVSVVIGKPKYHAGDRADLESAISHIHKTGPVTDFTLATEAVFTERPVTGLCRRAIDAAASFFSSALRASRVYRWR